MTQEQLMAVMTQYLQSRYENIIATPNYIIADGPLKVALVAHLDTVGQFPPHDIYYDQEKKVMWSPDLLGADDRAGVLGIIEIIESGYRPCVIFTTNEEIGCVGAQTLITQHKSYPFGKLKAIIQLDRRGKDDCVFYGCNNKEFIKYISKFGFRLNHGTFSDISVIAPAWKVCAVNLSIGYENEHSNIEILHTDWYEETIEKVRKILDKALDMKQYVYTGTNLSLFSYSALEPANDNQCFICGCRLTPKTRVKTPDDYYACKNCYELCYLSPY